MQTELVQINLVCAVLQECGKFVAAFPFMCAAAIKFPLLFVISFTSSPMKVWMEAGFCCVPPLYSMPECPSDQTNLKGSNCMLCVLVILKCNFSKSYLNFQEIFELDLFKYCLVFIRHDVVLVILWVGE